MIRSKIEKIKIQRSTSNKRQSSSRKLCNSKSPKRGTTLISKIHNVATSLEKPTINEFKLSKRSNCKLQNNFFTPRHSSKIKFSTPLRSMRFVNKMLSPQLEDEIEKNESSFNLAYFFKNFREELTDYESGEILNYPKIYYWGIKSDKIGRFEKSKGFDDDKANYILIRNDHISYRYEILKILGKGSFGIVCECFDHKEKEKIALKIIKNTKSLSTQAEIEIKILNLINENDPQKNYHLVRIKDSFIFRGHVCIVTELLGVNLYELQKSKSFSSFPSTIIKRYAFEILSSLKYLKSLQIIHCDLKPENILLTLDGKNSIKLIDFGSSCMAKEKLFTYIQSRFYRSPEVILGIGYTCSIDMWSLGCILAELSSGNPLFPADSEIELLQMIMQLKGAAPPDMLKQSLKRNKFFHMNEILPDKKGNILKPFTLRLCDVIVGDDLFIDFIDKCLTWDPLKRLKPEEALDHPWLLMNEAKSSIASAIILRTLKRKNFAVKKS